MAAPVLAEIEEYLDAVPRSGAHVEQIGPLTLFVTAGPGLAYYARPSLGATQLDPQAVQVVRCRQRVLGVPQAFEWVAETTPGMGAAAVGAGLTVVRYPLMVLDQPVAPATPVRAEVEVRLATLEDDFALLGAVAPLAFGAPGTAPGETGVEAVRASAGTADPARVALSRERVRRGQTIMAGAFVSGLPVGVGVHQPVGQVTELAGIGVLPAFRRSGIGAAITRRLAMDARERGIQTIFLSAGNDAIARVYGRIGFARVGTACAAEPRSGG